ncbi:hypothetical protein H4V95_001505 [Arthrobacter sp. CAN_C5]|nr:hypothetical protein [Arthrobacter sp. CAN_C5]
MALKDPPSRANHDRKRAKGKLHNQALIILAQRRYDTPYAVLRDGTILPITTGHSHLTKTTRAHP